MRWRELSRNLSVSGFPQAVAAIDCCHIRIKAPNKNWRLHKQEGVSLDCTPRFGG